MVLPPRTKYVQFLIEGANVTVSTYSKSDANFFDTISYPFAALPSYVTISGTDPIVDIDSFFLSFPDVGLVTLWTGIFPLNYYAPELSIFSNTFFFDQSAVISYFGISVLPPPVSPLVSLNGSGSEFVDGVSVKVDGRDLVYTVERSYMTLYSDNSYTAHYDLVSSNGAKLSCPEALLTQYTAPVIAP